MAECIIVEDIFGKTSLPLSTFDGNVSPILSHSSGSSWLYKKNLGLDPSCQSNSTIPNNEELLTVGNYYIKNLKLCLHKKEKFLR